MKNIFSSLLRKIANKDSNATPVNQQVSKITIAETCRYETQNASFGSMSFGTRIIQTPPYLLEKDFSGGTPIEPMIVQCKCGCELFRLYTKDAASVALGLRDRRDLWSAISELRARELIDQNEDSLLREEVNEIKFPEIPSSVIAQFSFSS